MLCLESREQHSSLFPSNQRRIRKTGTFRLSGVPPGAIRVRVAAPLPDGLHFTPERVQAEFVRVLLQVLGGGFAGAVGVLSGCLVRCAGPWLHAHFCGAGVSGADIHTREEITGVHANKWSKPTKTRTNTGRWRINEAAGRHKRMEGGLERDGRWRERRHKGGVSIVLAKCGQGRVNTPNVH